MIIGIDAGPLAITDNRLKVGVYRMTFELLKHLSLIDTKNVYRLYSFAPIPDDVLKHFGANMVNIVLYPKQGYMRLWLPLEIFLHPIDIFLGVSQALPFMLHGKSIGFIHDLGFLKKPKTYSGLSGQILERQTKYLVDTADHIVTVSQSVKDEILSKYDIHSHDVTVAYNGVSEVFSLQGEKVIGRNPYFLFVGSIRKGKNIPGLLKAYSVFIKQTKSTVDLYLIGGDYWNDEDVTNTIKELKLGKKVKRLGFVDDKKLAEYYRGALAFVTASFVEGFCLPAAEAISCGCPVITTKNGATPEIIGDAGIVVTEDDSLALANAMTTIVTQPVVRETFVKNCEARKGIFSWESFAVQIYSLLTKI